MALSNWDCLAVDFGGNPLDGRYVSPLGVEVCVYKNWLYIADQGAWRAAGPFVEPTVMQVYEGDLIYLDVHIVALRGPQDGIYAVVWTHHWADQPSWAGMVGIGVHGFEYPPDGDAKWVGLKPASFAWWCEALLLGTACLSNVPDAARQIDYERAVRFNQGDAYFTRTIGTDLQETSPGEARPPMLDRIAGQMEP